MSDPAIVLDPVIRDWVLLPLTAIIILAQLLRTIIIMVMQKPTNKSADELAQRSVLERSQRARVLAPFISESEFMKRKTWLLAQSARGLKSTPKAVPADPSMMTSGMQMQVVPYLFNIGLMTLVQTLYVGFVLVKLPFSLTARFRSVTQRDVVQAIDLLDPSLVTSFSWYLMCMYGCHGIITLVLGGKSSEFADQSAMMMSQMGMGGGKQQQWNASAAYKQERQQLRIVSPGPKALLASERAIVEAQQSGDDVETVAARQAAAEAESRKQRLSAGG